MVVSGKQEMKGFLIGTLSFLSVLQVDCGVRVLRTAVTLENNSRGNERLLVRDIEVAATSSVLDCKLSIIVSRDLQRQ